MSLDDFPAENNPAAASFAPTPIVSPAQGVALWFVALSVGDDLLARISAWLSPAEQARSARFGRDYLRRRYIIGRASLRRVLAETFSLDPAVVPIVRGQRGRPRLDGIAGVDFNISHTDEIALIGIARGPRIGVDIERSDREVNADGLARKFLTHAERTTLALLSADERRKRFLRYWTCKEAMSKATGEGLSARFRDLSLDLNGSRITLVMGVAPYEPSHWRLHQVALPSEYIATVALWFDAERPGPQ